IVLTTVPWWAAILRIPFAIIAPIIVVICAIGAYTVHNNMFDVYMMVVFGVVGYLFKKLKYPLAPLVLALVLGDMAESSFRQAMLLSGGSLKVFWSNGLVGSIVTLALVILVWPLVSRLIGALRTKGPSAPAPAGWWRSKTSATCTSRGERTEIFLRPRFVPTPGAKREMLTAPTPKQSVRAAASSALC